MSETIVIKNALVINGSGASTFKGDLAFQGDTIVEVGRGLPMTGAKVVDAKNLALAPGFIDPHGHSDMSILAAPEAMGKLSQGVTTEVAGNCGLSVFPITDLNREHLDDIYKQYNEKIKWSRVEDYAAEVDRRKPAMNIASLCGHNTLRAAFAGYGDAKMTGGMISDMRDALAKSLAQGAAGFSTGFLYIPGKFAGEDEVVRVMKAMSDTDKPYATHMRSEGARLLEAIDESIRITRESGTRKLHISHLKTSGRGNWPKLEEALKKIYKAREEGLPVTADRYPYTESMTQLSVISPPPYDVYDSVTLAKVLKNKAKFKDFEKVLSEHMEGAWDNVRLVCCSRKEFEKYQGMVFDEIGRTGGKNPAVICADILRKDSVGAMAAFRGMSPDNLMRIIMEPVVSCGSDESARPADYSVGRSHPRGFGSFPLFYRMLENRLGIEEVVRKMTSLPADVFNLKRRGLLVPGHIADMVLFDPAKFDSKANFANPHIICAGVDKVWVGGRLSYADGKCQERNGSFLKV